MCWRPLTWFLLSLLCLAGAFYFWRLGDQWEAQKRLARSAVQPAAQPARAKPAALKTPSGVIASASTAPLAWLPLSRTNTTVAAATNKFQYRLSNTTKPVGQLLRNDHAILLGNALLDTARPVSLAIPDALRAHGDPGSYIVQARGPLDDAFRALLQAAGATIVSRSRTTPISCGCPRPGRGQLAAGAQTQTVLPYEPYYKLQSPLLKLAVKGEPLPDGAALNLALFGDAADATIAAVKNLGAEVIGQDKSPFGPVLRVRPRAGSLSALAGLPGVQTS